MASGHLLVLAAVLAFCVTEAGAEWCTTTYSTTWGTSYSFFECSACCGWWPDQYCCLNIEAIAGGIIGFLIFVGAVVVVIILIKKHQQSRISVVPTQPVLASNTVVVSHCE